MIKKIFQFVFRLSFKQKKILIKEILLMNNKAKQI